MYACVRCAVTHTVLLPTRTPIAHRPPKQSILSVRQRLWFLRFMLSRVACAVEVNFLGTMARASAASFRASEVFWYWLRMVLYQPLMLGVAVDEVRVVFLRGICMWYLYEHVHAGVHAHARDCACENV